MRSVLEIAGVATIAYFTALSLSYVSFTALACRSITRHLRTRRYDGAVEALGSQLTPSVSVLVPAFNEEAGIVESVHSLLSLRYPEHEVIVVSDGSTDGTMSELARSFELVPVRRALRRSITHEPVRATYVSRRHPNLWVLDKENGGKADALNAAIGAARHAYFCAVDADAVIEDDALLRVAKPILDEPELVVATGGIVRIANGCKIDHGKVLDVGLPQSRLATLQVVEYFRAFLVGRIGWSHIDSLLIISGAFGLFHRETVEVVGGYSRDTVGEDAELVVRLHRHLRTCGEPYRIAFVPDPVCWTEAPEDLWTLSRQRRRWQRGLAEALWRHRRLAFDPRYGALGLLAVPYFVIFELFGPLFQVLSYVVIPVSVGFGALSPAYLAAFLVLALCMGSLLSLSALALEEFSFRRHPRGREVGRMLAYAIAENLGYRQLTDVWRVAGLIDVLRRRRDWGLMTRRGLGGLDLAGHDRPGADPLPAPSASPSEAVASDRTQL